MTVKEIDDTAAYRHLSEWRERVFGGNDTICRVDDVENARRVAELNPRDLFIVDYKSAPLHPGLSDDVVDEWRGQMLMVRRMVSSYKFPYHPSEDRVML